MCETLQKIDLVYSSRELQLLELVDVQEQNDSPRICVHVSCDLTREASKGVRIVRLCMAIM